MTRKLRANQSLRAFGGLAAIIGLIHGNAALAQSVAPESATQTDTSAAAQSTATEATGEFNDDDIIVTAQRRSETLERTPVAISVVGIFLNRKNLIVLLMAIELMLLAVNMNFVAFSHYLGDLHGQVFVFFILTVAAAESAIGLAILVLLFRNKSSISVEELNTLKG